MRSVLQMNVRANCKVINDQNEIEQSNITTTNDKKIKKQLRLVVDFFTFSSKSFDSAKLLYLLYVHYYIIIIMMIIIIN